MVNREYRRHRSRYPLWHWHDVSTRLLWQCRSITRAGRHTHHGTKCSAASTSTFAPCGQSFFASISICKMLTATLTDTGPVGEGTIQLAGPSFRALENSKIRPACTETADKRACYHRFAHLCKISGLGADRDRIFACTEKSDRLGAGINFKSPKGWAR